MKIVFDNIIYSLQHYGGVSVVWNNLVSRIVHTGHDVQFVEYDDAQQNISRQLLQLPPERLHIRSSFLMALRRYFNPQLPQSITRRLDEGGRQPFIFHSSYFRISTDPRAINVTTVHDFTYELFVQNWLKRWLHCRQKHAAIRKSQHVVCISDNTRRDLLRILPDVDPAKVHVIYNGVESGRFYPLEGAEHQDFALFVGRRDHYKNFHAILHPLAEHGITLRIVGETLSSKELLLLQQSGIRYHYCGMVSDEELNRLYNQALFLFYPSCYEGFGLPVLEAQMAGCPVLAFNASSIPEIIGDSTLLLNDISAQSIRPYLQRFRDPLSRQAVIADGLLNAARFSWDRTAEQYLQIYQQGINNMN